MKKSTSRFIRDLINPILKKCVSCQLVRQERALNSGSETWRNLCLNGFSPEFIVDVGAASGEWTESVIPIFPSAKFLLVDPLEENRPKLEKLKNAHPEKVQYYLGALGKEDGELLLHVNGEQTSSFKSNWGGEPRRVPMKKLDTLLDERRIRCVDAIKLDVQGAEIDVLTSFRRVDEVQVVQIECSFLRIYESAPLVLDIAVFFAQKGFRLLDFVEVFKRQDGKILQADLFFTKNDALFGSEKWN